MRLGGCFSLVAIFLCLCVGVGSTDESVNAPLPGVAAGDPEMIPFSNDSATGSKPSVSVIHENDNGLLLEFDLPEIAILPLEVEGQIFHALEIAGGAFRGEVGDPMLPTYSRLIQIPDGVGVTYDIETITTTELTGYRPVPMQPGDNSSFTINNESYAQIGYGESVASEIGEPAIARNLRVVPITFNPVRFDPAGGTVEVASKIRVQVNFDGVDLRNEAPAFHRVIPESFDQMYKKLVVNYAGPRSDQTVGLGKYVIICQNNSTVISKLAPLVEWRTRKGHDVYLATTSETGSSSSSIKNWLTNAYENWDVPPEYIVLIGDSGGSVSIPYWSENYSYYNGEGDHPYVQLDGSDVLADAHIGRISVSSTSQLELYVNKIVGYESTPYMSDTDWYIRGCVTGDPGSSGYTCVQSMQWLKSKMLAYGYAEVDTIFSGPFVSQMSSKINRGCTVFGYRGYYHMSGMDTGDIGNLSNGRKMPFAVILTCDTGSFASGYARSEAFMRAGSAPNSPTGGIASIGTATTGTHTRFNNCVTYGIWSSIYDDFNYQFGTCLTRGKYELYLNYWAHDSNDVRIFSHWNNLMGDPAGEMWTGVPQSLNVSHPTSIATGANSVIVGVTEGLNSPCANAFVCLWKDDETYTGGYTNAIGQIELAVSTPSSGTMKITVTKHDYHPYLSNISVGSQAQYVGYQDHDISGDGTANPGETFGLTVQLKNFGSQSASNVTATLTCDDPFVTLIDSDESFGTIPAGGTSWCSEDFDIQLAGRAPYGHVIQIGLDARSGSQSWHSVIEIPVSAAAFSYRDMTVYNVGTRFDPGDNGQISLEINNIGNVTGTSVTGTLSTTSQWVSITDPSGSFGNINAGSYGNNSGNRFGASVASDCYQGHRAEMKLALTFSSGALDTLFFELPIGQATTSSPTGPDSYGYYAYDNTDTGYPEAPTDITWIEVSPYNGGSGVSANLSDFGTAQDDSDVFNLPFDFQYYGEDYSKVTICSNGWMAMGSNYLTNYRNWTIPAAGAPPNMIAPMWDNLYQSGNNKVYYWADTANHRFVVQWCNVKNMYPSSHPTSNFEVILYDPEFYPTDTGDGIIVFAYQSFNNSDSEQMYSTVGIQNSVATTGLEYSYWNGYNTGAASITGGRIIKFMAKAMISSGTLSGTVTNASNGNAPLPGAQIHLPETGQTFVTDTDGLYTGNVPVGIYTVVASHPSFDSETSYDVDIEEGGSVVRNFSLTDIAPPEFMNTTLHANTTDTNGPYNIYTTVVEYSSLEEVTLYYNIGHGWTSTPMTLLINEHHASIPGAPYTSMVHYYILARDSNGLERTDPVGGQNESYYFWVIPPAVEYDVEDGIGDWTHEIASGGFNDEWHRSDARNHTGGGAYSWKFGGEGTSDYDGLADGALSSPVFELDSGATLTFWHRMNAEENSSNPSQAYDGGFVEMRVDGGSWSQITPVGGYTHTTVVGGGPGPYPEGTPVYSGDFDWAEASFRLEIEGSIQIRFRFGSDDNTHGEGWYVDDIFIVADSPGLADTPELTVISTQILYQNQPNPFSATIDETRIQFDLPHSSAVELKVFDTSGRLVRNLVDTNLPSGRHLVSWNGRDENNRLSGSGVYYYILKTDSSSQAKQMLIIR